MRPLVMRCGAFGDMVLLTVLLRHLHARFGEPVDLISSGPWTASILEGQTALGRLFLVRSRRTPYWLSLDQRRLVRWLRARGAGPTWFCDLGPGRALLERAGIGAPAICDSREHPWRPDENFADRYIRLGNETPAAFRNAAPPPYAGSLRAARLVVSDEARATAEAWLERRSLGGRPYVIVHPGSRHVARRRMRARAGASKYWPERNWASVVRGLRDACPDHAIVLTGTGAEHRMNDEIIRRAGVNDAHNVADGLSVRVLLPVLERAHSMISVDTGPAHAAAALGRPTVALFSSANPILFRPGGAVTPAVALTGRIDGEPAIQGIRPEVVLAAWQDLVRHPQRHTGGLSDRESSLEQ